MQQQQANKKESDGNITMNTQNKENTATQNEQQIDNQENDIFNILSNIEKHLSSIAYSLDYFVFNHRRPTNKTHSVPD